MRFSHRPGRFRRALRRFAGLVLVQALLAGGITAAPDGAPIRFGDYTEASGIDFVHTNGGSVPIVIYEQIPPGAAWLDYDGDGDLDLFAVQSGPHRFPLPAGATAPTHRLFRNDGASFVDVTAAAGIVPGAYGMGAAAGDIDGDGDVDLYVTAYGPNALYLNQGDGTLREVGARAGVDDPRMSMSAAFLDADGDGLLDLYVANYVDYASGPEFCIYNGIKAGCSDREYDGLPNSFYRNLGPGADGIPRFQDVAADRGVLDPKGRGLGVVTGDLNDDGIIDIYLANDGGGNRLFVGDGRGGFQDFTLMSGTGYSEAGLGEAGMGTDLGDIDGDGRIDIMVTNFARETNALYRSDGDGLFTHDTVSVGLAGPSFVPLGWGTSFLDADLDGWLDLFVANGHVYDVCNQINPQDTFEQRNQMFRNEGKGRFVEVTEQAGPGLALMEVSRGAAFGDFDDDGDVDIWVANDGGRGSLLRNESPRDGHHFLGVALQGTSSNRDSIGARVTLDAGDHPQVMDRRSGGSYLSSSDPRLHFGLGAAARAERLQVRWPSGSRVAFRGLPADILYVVREPSTR